MNGGAVMLVQVLSAIHNITTHAFRDFLFRFFSWGETQTQKYPGFISAVLRTGIVIYY